MSNANLKMFYNSIKTNVIKYRPEILMGIGIGTGITAVGLSIKATFKASKALDEAKEEKTNAIIENNPDIFVEDLEEESKLTPKETFKTVYKYYIPTASAVAVELLCLIASISDSSKRNAALAAAYTLSENTLRDYKDQVVEAVGEKKAQTIKDEVARKNVERHPVKNESDIIVVKEGGTLFYEPLTDKYIRSDIEAIRKAANDINLRLRDEMYISVNDWLEELGCTPSIIANDIGWNINHNGYVDIDLSSACVSSFGQPCIIIDHYNRPDYRFRNY